MYDKVEVVLDGSLPLVDILSSLNNEDETSIEEELETVALQPRENQVICLDLVHDVVELCIFWLSSLALFKVVSQQIGHVLVQVRANDQLHHCFDPHVEPLHVVASPLLLLRLKSFVFLFAGEFFRLGPCSRLRLLLGPPSLLYFFLNPAVFIHLGLVFLLFHDLEDVIVWLLWLLLLVSIVLDLLNFGVEIVLEITQVNLAFDLFFLRR